MKCYVIEKIVEVPRTVERIKEVKVRIDKIVEKQLHVTCTSLHRKLKDLVVEDT